MRNDKNYSKLNEYYNKFNEDKRLDRRHGQVEFITSLNFLMKYLRVGERIVDIGAGTGKYSFALGMLGYDIDAVEYTMSNYKVLENNKKIYDEKSYADTVQNNAVIKKYIDKLWLEKRGIENANKGNVNIYQGDARNLKKLEKNHYDKAIMFGPMYHLPYNEKIKAINEMKTVLKKNGIMFVSYIMNDYAVLYHGFIEGCFKNDKDKINADYRIIENEDDLYYYSTIGDIDKINEECNLESICRFSQEGPSDFIRQTLNKMDDETFDEYLKLQLKNCTKKELLGAGTHVVDVVRIG